MKSKQTKAWLRFATVLAAILLALTSARAGTTDAAVRKVGRALDKTAKEIEEYGSIHMSAPLLSLPGDDFKFDLRYGATNYFNDAKTQVQGSAAMFEQVVQSFQGGIAGQWDPTVTAGFLSQLENYQDERGRFRRKQNLLDGAAQLEYLSAIQRANQLTNQQARIEAIAAAERAYGEKTTTNTNAPAYPTAGPENLPDLPQGIAKPPTDALSRLASSNFFGPGGLLKEFKSKEPELNNRAALITAAGDVAVESIFRLLGRPDKAKEFMGREIFFGVATVSVNPGWRTRKNFAADLSVTTSYQYKSARKDVAKAYLEKNKTSLTPALLVHLAQSHGLEPTQFINVTKKIRAAAKLDIKDISNPLSESDWATNVAQRFPSAFALSPLTETDALDLSSSFRRQNELALNLALALRYAGAKGQAEAFEQYVRSRQSDFRTRSTAIAVNTYSDSGGLLGVQVGPRLRAIEEPGKEKFGEPGNVLDRQSFPLLMLFGIDKDDFSPKIGTNKMGRLEIVEPVLRLTQLPHWRPLTHDFFSARDWFEPKNWFQPRQSELKRLRLSYDLAQTKAAKKDLFENGLGLVEAKERALKWHAFGGVHDQTLPAELVVPPPATKQIVLAKVTSLVPTTFSLKPGQNPVQFTVVLAGENLKVVNASQITEVGQRAQVTNPRTFGNAIVIDVLPNAPVQDSTPLVFSLPLDPAKSGIDPAQPYSVLSLPFHLVRESVPNQPPATVIRAVMNSPEDSRKGDVTVEISGTASAESLNTAKSIVETELNRAKPAAGNNSANINVNVEAAEQKNKK